MSSAGVALWVLSACSSEGPYVYVANEGSGDVMIIDAGGKDGSAGFVKVGKRPRAMALSGDGRLLFVATTGSPPPPGKEGPPRASTPPPPMASPSSTPRRRS